MKFRKIVVTGAAVTALVAGGTAAAAAVAGPIDGSGTIHGCYYPATAGGSHTVILQDTGTNCPSGTTAIKWNQAGPAGPQGPQGATGPQGPSGTSQAYTYLRSNWPEVPPVGSSPQSMGSLSLPAGAYLASATVEFFNQANFFAQDNHRYIQCQLSPAPDVYNLRIDGADTDSNLATLSINVAFGYISHAFTASLDCTALDGGSDQSWVHAETVRINALALDNVTPQ